VSINAKKRKTPKLAAEAGSKTFRASHRWAQISPFKARPVVDLVRGHNVDAALEILRWQDRRAAPLIARVVKSALANASNDLEADLKRLFVQDARIDGAGLLNGRKRFMQRAMGRAFPIMKRVCHISITLAQAAEADAEKARSRARRARTKKPAADGGPVAAAKESS
jgi:large subunit ribosomal protein L22